MNEQFAREIVEGFETTPRKLPSKYFYDDRGSELFQAIMHAPEYYLSNAELEVFQHSGSAILDALKIKGGTLHLIELGAGDGSKTVELLDQALSKNLDIQYSPLDISQGALNDLAEVVKARCPDLKMEPITNTYFEGLSQLQTAAEDSKLVMFLGSTIGNFTKREALDFLTQLCGRMDQGDYLLIGFDLMKNPRQILSAYDDRGGVTRQFNLNLLHRINRELEGNIPLDEFEHYPTYDPQTGECRSYILPKKEVDIELKKVNKRYTLKAWEPIHTETSTKYSLKEIANLGASAGFELIRDFFDCKHYYTNALWKKP